MSTAPAPARGRPRSSAADAAILDATRDLLAEGGWTALTVEGVAARAGVAKTTVYRRFASRTELAVAVLADLLESTWTALEASDDPHRAVRDAIRACAAAYRSPSARAAYLAVIAAADRDPALRAAVDERVVDQARRIVARGLGLMLEQGSTTAAGAAAVIESDLLLDLVAGALVHRILVRGQDVDEAFVEQLATAALASVRAAGA
jgi:AcrR family transcriptional regulator